MGMNLARLRDRRQASDSGAGGTRRKAAGGEPSKPARKPDRKDCRFYPAEAALEGAGKHHYLSFWLCICILCYENNKGFPSNPEQPASQNKTCRWPEAGGGSPCGAGRR